MNRGYVKIKGSVDQGFIIEAKMVDGNLWLTKHEMADLFNTNVSMVGNNLCAIFKSGILHKENVIHVHLSERNGKPCEMTLYNFEALIFVSYRIASYEASAFRQWVVMALGEYLENGQNDHKKEVLVIYNLGKGLPSIVTLN